MTSEAMTNAAIMRNEPQSSHKVTRWIATAILSPTLITTVTAQTLEKRVTELAAKNAFEAVSVEFLQSHRTAVENDEKMPPTAKTAILEPLSAAVNALQEEQAFHLR